MFSQSFSCASHAIRSSIAFFPPYTDQGQAISVVVSAGLITSNLANLSLSILPPFLIRFHIFPPSSRSKILTPSQGHSARSPRFPLWDRPLPFAAPLATLSARLWARGGGEPLLPDPAYKEIPLRAAFLMALSGPRGSASALINHRVTFTVPYRTSFACPLLLGLKYRKVCRFHDLHTALVPFLYQVLAAPNSRRQYCGGLIPASVI